MQGRCRSLVIYSKRTIRNVKVRNMKLDTKRNREAGRRRRFAAICLLTYSKIKLLCHSDSIDFVSLRQCLLLDGMCFMLWHNIGA